MRGGPAAVRFIPACAGNSATRTPRSGSAAVHPRVCGELRGSATRSTCCHGSSPRVRGTPIAENVALPRGRFIPACAGNSVPRTPGNSRTAVHPRVCGELVQALADAAPNLGSSPRVRGTHGHLAGAARRGRFIPACAGNSPAATATRRSQAVHPRVCGELASTSAWTPAMPGSSPRVRGTRRKA